MVLGHWAHSHRLWPLIMVGMEGAVVMVVLIVMGEITIGSDTEMMTTMHVSPQRETRIMNPGEPLTMTLDRRRIHVSERAVILMKKKKMIVNGDLNRYIMF